MKIHEYQAKELLAAEGAAIPKGVVATSTAEAQRAFDDFGARPVVLKAQIHAGGRGKGQFKNSGKTFGGVKYVTTREDVGAVADVVFRRTSLPPVPPSRHPQRAERPGHV